MAEDEAPPRKPHLILTTPASKDSFISPKRPDSEFKFVIHKRESHAQYLKSQIEDIRQQADAIATKRESLGIKGDYGIYLEFASEQNYDLKFESLESQKKGIEIQNIREDNGIYYATVYVPEGELGYFINKIEKYRTELTKYEKPKNQTLVESISSVRMASLQSFWTDSEKELFNVISNNEQRWWEIWLRVGENRESIRDRFIETANLSGIEVLTSQLSFPERTIILARASKEQLSNSVILLDCIAEIRIPHDTAESFIRMDAPEQREWTQDLLNRIIPPNNDSPSVCLLDYGINNGHPLIQPALDLSGMHTYDPTWGVNDNHGHGTNIAGIILFGDLFYPLRSNNQIELRHKLESVKMLQINQQHDPKLYGFVTQECVYRAEIAAPTRLRTICTTVSSTSTKDLGRPTSWSAAIDQLCFGSDAEDKTQRLICLSTGNLENLEDIKNYPYRNQAEGIHDPGQSWNALTIGAYTEKVTFDAARFPNHVPLAPFGGLCPSSTTSCVWQKKWPNKPDIVFEGGNLLIENSTGNVDYNDSLQLLTTHHLPYVKHYVTIGDTSAATALASRLAAIIQSHYRNFWPETIRGLIVHSARWSDEMLRGINILNATEIQIRNLLRTYGYGHPNVDQALWSANNHLTLIAQDSLQPFESFENDIRTKDINFHNLPWPTNIFHELGDLEIKIRVTLSYYIEPNPSNRYSADRFDYPSHRLRFELKRGAESLTEFQKRINKSSREENEKFQSTTNELKWIIGSRSRNKGSIHSDIWIGTAAELASMDSIAVFPGIGWWRIRKKLSKYNSIARYSLIVSIETERQDIDLYTPIEAIVRQPIQISI